MSHSYDAISYTNLLKTYSDHRKLDDTKLERLLKGIAELINTEFGGRMVKEYLTILYVARRR